MKKNLFYYVILITILTLFAAPVFAKPKKPLHNGRYTFVQLKKRGYNVQPFKGRIFITYKKYLEINKL